MELPYTNFVIDIWEQLIFFHSSNCNSIPNWLVIVKFKYQSGIEYQSQRLPAQ